MNTPNKPATAAAPNVAVFLSDRLIAGQAVLLNVAALWLPRGSARPAGGSGVPRTQLAVLPVGVGAIAAADVIPRAWAVLALVAVGLAILSSRP